VRHLIPEFERMKERFPEGFDSSLVLPCLHRIQADRGFVAEEDIVGLCEYLKVPRIQVEEVLSYYTMLRREGIGKTHLQVCRNIACSMRGAEGVIEHACKRLGVKPGQTTADGKFTLSTVECLGSCGTAPVMMVNDAYHENMTLEKLDALIADLSSGQGKS
jgi:NADH-quinone oxidoreductase subunit E